VDKETDPALSTQLFSFTSDPDLSIPELDDDDDPFESEFLEAGIFTVNEDGETGWALTNVTCVSEKEISDVSAVGDDLDPHATIDLAPGDTVTCTFTNTQLANILVSKVCNPETASADFNTTWTFNGGDPQEGPTLDCGDTEVPVVTDTLDFGAYTLAEIVPDGWDQTGASCEGSEGAENPEALDLEAGETIICTFENTQRGLITIVKDTVDGIGLFCFDGVEVDGEVVPFGNFDHFCLDTIAFNGGGTAQTSYVVKPGSYSVAEDLLDLPSINWEYTQVTCDDPTTDSTLLDEVLALAEIEVDPGETVVCTFVNTLQEELQACSPGYWRQPQHFGSYPWDPDDWVPNVVPVGFNPGDGFLDATLYTSVFNVGGYTGATGLTFPQAIGLGGGGFNVLVRHSAAAYLNSLVLNYGLEPLDVINLTNNAFAAGVGSQAYHDAINAFTELLEDENCTLGRSTLPGGTDFGNGQGGGIGQQ
ncbi:MAG: hypothetical protein HYX73_01560, partial [Acidobacteria bacterium]|nr:hypothetical protein [Acidobacteriota bacterium]